MVPKLSSISRFVLFMFFPCAGASSNFYAILNNIGQDYSTEKNRSQSLND